MQYNFSWNNSKIIHSVLAPVYELENEISCTFIKTLEALSAHNTFIMIPPWNVPQGWWINTDFFFLNGFSAGPADKHLEWADRNTFWTMKGEAQPQLVWMGENGREAAAVFQSGASSVMNGRECDSELDGWPLCLGGHIQKPVQRACAHKHTHTHRTDTGTHGNK